VREIESGEWKHVRWFYDNCNWRRGRRGDTFSVTSTRHGSPTAAARNPCETLYRLLLAVRKYEEEAKGKGWEEVYMMVVKKKDEVARKGKKAREKPNVVNWPK
jgi:hypothetical protein